MAGRRGQDVAEHETAGIDPVTCAGHPERVIDGGGQKNSRAT
jgi:hypothetical protein